MGSNHFYGLLAFNFVASNARLDSHEKMKLCTDPFSQSYAEYLLKVSNGQEFSIINHFPPKADAEPLVGVEINLYLEIHQAPSLDTLIHVVFSTLAINYAN